MKLEVRVQPKSSKSLVEIINGQIRIKVNSPAVNGRANEEAIKLMAGFLNVKKSNVKIISGKNGRKKLLEVEGITEEKLKAIIQLESKG